MSPLGRGAYCHGSARCVGTLLLPPTRYTGGPDAWTGLRLAAHARTSDSDGGRESWHRVIAQAMRGDAMDLGLLWHATDPLVTVRSLTKRFGERTAVDGVTFE